MNRRGAGKRKGRVEREMQPKEIEIPEKVRRFCKICSETTWKRNMWIEGRGRRPPFRALLRPGAGIAGGLATLSRPGCWSWCKARSTGSSTGMKRTWAKRREKSGCGQAFEADVLLCSANAILESGELYQVDGLSNRIAPLVYGPDRVIVVAGVNKIVEDLAQAAHRVRTITAPAIVKKVGF